MAKNTKEKSPSQRLIDAIARGDVEATRLALDSGANANHQDEEGFTPLMFAASRGRAEIMRLLLSAGADPRLKDIEGQTAATLAVYVGDRETLRVLLPALHSRDERICRLKLELLERGDVPEAVASLLCATRAGDLASVKDVLTIGATVDGRNEEGETALMMAAAGNHSAIVKELLMAGASPTLRNLDDWCPLEVAAYRGAPAAYEALRSFTPEHIRIPIENWVDSARKRKAWRYDRPDLDLKRATQRVDDEIFERLRKSLSFLSADKPAKILDTYGIPVDCIDKDGRTPLMMAVEANNLDLVIELLNRGADANHTDYFGRSAISIACSSESSFQIARWLWKRSNTILQKEESSSIANFGWELD